MTNLPEAGWYPDANGETRWWDGQQWTEHTASNYQATAGAQQQATAWDQPNQQQATWDQSGAQQAAQQPQYDYPSQSEPTYSQPAYTEPVYEEPVYEQPAQEQAAAEHPQSSASEIVHDPVAEQPSFTEPVAPAPSPEEPPVRPTFEVTEAPEPVAEWAPEPAPAPSAASAADHATAYPQYGHDYSVGQPTDTNRDDPYAQAGVETHLKVPQSAGKGKMLVPLLSGLIGLLIGLIAGIGIGFALDDGGSDDAASAPISAQVVTGQR